VVQAAEQVARSAVIVELAGQGLSQRTIAAQTGASKSTVARVLAAAAAAARSTAPELVDQGPVLVDR
jgi:transposase